MTTSEETSLRGRRHNPIDRVRASVRTLTLTQLCSRSPAPHWENAGKKQVDQRLVTNLKALCRKHHLLKTFGGWTEIQGPDGTVLWKAPTGHTYVTTPASRFLFPTLTRQRTRKQERDRRRQSERSLNRQERLQREAALAALTAHDPPPF